MRKIAVVVCLTVALPFSAAAQKPPLLPERDVAALAQELSGEAARRNLQAITLYHRVRGSRGFHAAAEWVAERARAYGLSDARILEFPADGKTFFGTQKSRLAWDADFAELWEMREQTGRWIPAVRLASLDAMPVTLAEDSESADVAADLVDVGEGTRESDYAGKDVRGKIVLTAAQPGAVERLAVGKLGAAGIVSYAQNQHTAWWGEDENLVRWGHLESFSPIKTFAFMVSLKTARSMRQRLARGETIHLHATVRGGQHPGNLEVVTATIPGDDPSRREEEIAFSCHLDHQQPGANDNASGCVAILEAARTLAKLIAEGKLARPARTLRFIWPPEIEGTETLLNARPELPARIKAAIHMDMVGGGPQTKAIFRVTRSPASVPSFVSDVAEAFAEFVNEQSDEFASRGETAYPLVAPEGGKEALLAQMAEFTMGSDHQVYTEGSFRIPAIYLNDWPDRYIHTNFDSPAMIDPTKLERAAFIGAASGYYLARFGPADVPAALEVIERGALQRAAWMLGRRVGAAPGEAANLARFELSYEQAVFDSVARFTPLTESGRTQVNQFLASLQAVVGGVPPGSPASGDGLLVFQRNPEPRGPLSVFGYDYLADHYGAERARKLTLLNYQGLRGSGGEYAYEVLNFVDGKRNAQQIRDAVSAEYGPVPLAAVVEYLRALETIGLLRRVP